MWKPFYGKSIADMISGSDIGEIKEELQAGHISKIKTVLSKCSDASTIKILREQKVLFAAKEASLRTELVTHFKNAVTRVCGPGLTEKEALYADFVLLISSRYLNLEQSFEQGISKWACNRSLKEILSLTNVSLESEQKKLIDSYVKFLEQTATGVDNSSKAELNAYAMHMFNARNNDISFALSNFINTSAKYCRSGDEHVGPPVSDGDSEVFQSLISISSELINYQWIVDKVSYGEWNVSKITYCNKPEIVFDVSDIRLEFARELGIRSDIISMHLGKKHKRWLHELLENSASTFVDDALDYYQGSGRLLLYSSRQYKDLKSDINRFLDMLDAEDELLVGLNKKNPEVIAHYLFAVSLMCFSRAALFCRKHMAKTHENSFACYNIPLKRIQGLLIRYSEIESVNLNEVITNLTTVLPTLTHFDIIRKPNIKTKEGLLGLSAFSYGNWPSTVRSISYQGGKAANIVGNAWEGYIAYTLKQYKWKVLGTGVKLDKGLPDIDIVATDKNLLLLIQVKTTYGAGVNTFEQWKSREKIMKGAEQALKALEAVNNNDKLLAKLRNNEKVDSSGIIQPLVITNSHIFNGWNFRGVPVISTSSLMQILRGAKVDYMTLDKKRLTSKTFAMHGGLTPEEFLSFLNNPLDWRISNEKIAVEHEKGEMSDMIFYFPKIKRADGLKLSDIIPMNY